MTQMYDIAGAQSKPNQKQKHRSIRSEEHTSELQSQSNLVCRLLLEKKKNQINMLTIVCAQGATLHNPTNEPIKVNSVDMIYHHICHAHVLLGFHLSPRNIQSRDVPI